MTETYKREILKGKEGGSKVKINILVILHEWFKKDPARRKYNVFIGASFLANIMKEQNEYWITKAEWDEVGPRCLDKISESIKIWDIIYIIPWKL